MACGVWGSASIRPASQTSQQVTWPWCWVILPSLSPYRAQGLVPILRRDHQGMAQCAGDQGQAGLGSRNPAQRLEGLAGAGPLLASLFSFTFSTFFSGTSFSCPPCAPFSALDLFLIKKTRDPLSPPIFLYFVLTLSAPHIISCLFPLPPHCLSSISLPFSSLYPSPTTGPACSSLTAPVLHLPSHTVCMRAHTHT